MISDIKIIWLLLISLHVIVSSPVRNERDVNSCALQACPVLDPKRINVHIIPHSHDDAGWLKTVDQYYFGSNNDIQNAGVQYIISSVVEALLANPERRFIQVESVFFWKWWQEQDERMRQNFIHLVNSGQIEMINGAWSMNDEAAAHYHSIIDQFTWGLRTLNETLGTCGRPKIGWQIDPFGHSREHASILKQLGYEALVIGRLDYRDKMRRQLEKDLDFLWDTSDDLDDSILFTTMFPEFYGTIDGLCWDITCRDSPINNDITSPGYNLNTKVNILTLHISWYQNFYKTSNVLIPFGGDFNYQAAESNYINIDKLLKAMKTNEDYNVFYSTPSCYVKAVNDELAKNALKLSTKSDDFFPYASDPRSFWTGYFTSRPSSKRFERLGNNILQAAKQLATFSKAAGFNIDEYITPLREIMGVMQHHDAITGTEKQAVAKDYHRSLTKGIHRAEEPITDVLKNLLQVDPKADLPVTFSTCLLANISICDATGNGRFLVAVYNPLARTVNHYVRLPVEDSLYKVTGPDGEEVNDVLDSLSSFDYIPKISTRPKELVFLARDLPPLGLKLYYVEKQSGRSQPSSAFIRALSRVFGTEKNGFTINSRTNLLESVMIDGLNLNIKQEFWYYNGEVGDNEPHPVLRNRSSGAYIFRPLDSLALPISTDGITVTFQRGQLVDEVKQVINNEITQIIRVYKDDDHSYIEFDWLVGDLSYDLYWHGQEVITRFTIEDFSNKGIFYTDANGRQLLKRELNKRADYEYDPAEEPVSGNYYPITSKIVLKDETQGLEVAVLNDRAQGGSSLSEGVIELMIHRRLLTDDGFGVEEALNEVEYDKGLYVRGQHWLTFGSTKKQVAANERDLALKKLLQPWTLVADISSEQLTYDELSKLIKFEFQGLTKDLPDNVHLLTLEPWQDDAVLLRLEHIFQKGEDASLSLPVQNLFSEFSVNEVRETTLGANEFIEDYEKREKLSWNGTPTSAKSDRSALPKVALTPMQIRTFVAKINRT